MEDTAQARWVWDEVQAVLGSELAREGEALCCGDLRAIEACLQPLLRRVGGALLSGLARLRLAGLAGERERTVVGLVGEVRVRRPYYHCGACKAGMAPLDAAWGLGGGSLSPELARVACRDGLEAAFGQGADLVWENLGVHLDEEQVRGISEALGAVVEADQQDPASWALPAADPAPAILVLELDGVLVHERDAWREMKVGRVAPLGPGRVVDEETGEARLALGPSTYCAGREEAERFWPRAMREVARAGWGRGVREVVLIADGAEWIWRQARCQLRREGVAVVEILDFYHACEHLAALAPPTAAAADLLRRARLYFRTHAHRMDYPAFRARGFPIGSGAIESCAKNLIQARQAQAGMRWSTAGAQCLASLRALHRSGRWDAFWHPQPQRRLRLLRPRQPWAHAQAPDQAAPDQVALAPARPPASPGTPDAAAPPDVAQPDPPAAPRARIQTAGKPWAKGKDHWRRSPIAPQRSA